jgi:hypothetical protein
VLDRLECRASTLSDWHETHLLRLVIIVGKQREEGHCHSRYDNREYSKSPAETGTIQERRSNWPTDPGRDDVWRGCKGKHQPSIFECGSIGDEDGQAVVHTIISAR